MSDRIIPWSIGCRTDVVFGGRKVSIIDFKSLAFGCTTQSSTSNRNFFFFFIKSRSQSRSQLSKISDVIHAYNLINKIVSIINWQWFNTDKTSWFLRFSNNKQSFFSLLRLDLLLPWQLSCLLITCLHYNSHQLAEQLKLRIPKLLLLPAT